MDERRLQLRVGWMVLATLLILAILVALINEPRAIWPGASYTVDVKFDQAPNVTQHTPIRKSGILIGRVTYVKLLDDGGVKITAELDGDKRVRSNEAFCIVNDLFGDAVINVIPSDDPNAPDTFIEDGAQLAGEVLPSPTQVIQKLDEKLSKVIDSVTGAGDALGTASTDLSRAARNVSSLLTDNKEKIEQAISQANVTLLAVEELTKSTSNLLGSEESRMRLRESLEDLPDTLDSMGNTIKMAELSLKRFVEPPPGSGRSGLDKMFSTIDRLDIVMGNVASFSGNLETFGQNLNNADGSLGKFIQDPELYNHLNGAAKRIDEVSWRLKPIVEDVRIFTDKIARHPETLGVRGAMQRQAGIK